MNKKQKLTNYQLSIRNGFTLTELLVVVAIMGMLAGIMLPTLNNARERGRRAVCAGSLKVIGEAFNMYNIDLACMPTTEEFFVPGTNTATNQISESGTPGGMGYFYDEYIEDFAVFVCPSSSSADLRNPKILKQNWDNANDTFSAYIYRAESGGNTLILSDSEPAIAMDYNDIRDPTDEKYNHKGEHVNILFRNGYVKGVDNKDDAGESSPDGQLTLGGDATDEDELFTNADGQ